MILSHIYQSYRLFNMKQWDRMWESDTMYGRTKYLYGNIYTQVFSNGTFFSEIYLIARKSYDGIELKTFITEFLFPERLTNDGSKEQNVPGTEFMKCYRNNDIQVTRTEPKLPNQNLEEKLIWEVQKY